MKDRFREMPCMDDMKRLIKDEMKHLTKKDMDKKKEKKWCLIGIGVIAVLVGVIVWIAKKRDKDLEEHYEYFDDLDGDDYDEFDDSIYDTDEDDAIEYVKINDFIKDEEIKEDQQAEEVETEAETKEADTKKTTSKKSKSTKKTDEQNNN